MAKKRSHPSMLVLMESAIQSARLKIDEEATEAKEELETDFDDFENMLEDRERHQAKVDEIDEHIAKMMKKYGADKLQPPKHVRQAAGRKKRSAATGGKVSAGAQPVLANFILAGMAKDLHSTDELTQYAEDRGYSTTSKNFKGVVSQCLGHSPYFRRTGRGRWARTRKGMAQWLAVRAEMEE